MADLAGEKKEDDRLFMRKKNRQGGGSAVPRPAKVKEVMPYKDPHYSLTESERERKREGVYNLLDE